MIIRLLSPRIFVLRICVSPVCVCLMFVEDMLAGVKHIRNNLILGLDCVTDCDGVLH